MIWDIFPEVDLYSVRRSCIPPNGRWWSRWSRPLSVGGVTVWPYVFCLPRVYTTPKGDLAPGIFYGTRAHDVSRSFQSWVSTTQSVELTADVFVVFLQGSTRRTDRSDRSSRSWLAVMRCYAGSVCSAYPTQETLETWPRSCRLYGSHPAARAWSYS